MKGASLWVIVLAAAAVADIAMAFTFAQIGRIPRHTASVIAAKYAMRGGISRPITAVARSRARGEARR